MTAEMAITETELFLAIYVSLTLYAPPWKPKSLRLYGNSLS